MEQLKAKLKKQGGFTMVELLIVVAIIAILVAVSIPMMNQALETSREAVDSANERDARGLTVTAYMTIEKGETGDVGINKEVGTAGGFAYYAVNEKDNIGALVKNLPAKAEAYGQGTAAGEEEEPRVGKVIKVTLQEDVAAPSGVKITTEWVEETGTTPPADP